MTNHYADGCGDSNSGITAQRVAGAWSLENLSWDSQPSAVTTGEATTRDPEVCEEGSNTSRNVSWSWPITEITQAWASGTQNNGLVLRGRDESLTAPVYDRGFRSSRSASTDAQKPTLVVTYLDSGASPPALTGSADLTPPTVLESSPIDGAENVPANQPITFRFSEAITGARVTLVNVLSGGEVAGTTQLSQNNTTLTFTPAQALNGVYDAQLSDAKDSTDISMALYMFRFATQGQVDNSAIGSRSQLRQSGGPRVRGGDFKNGRLIVSTTEPELMLSVNDGPHSVEFQVAHDPARISQGRGLIWQSTASTPPKVRVAHVKVPASRLKNGWLVQWRTRIAGGGSRSPWNKFQVDVPTKASATAGTTEVLPSNKSWPENISDFNECLGDNARLSDRAQGWLKNRFNWCQTRFVKARQWVKQGEKKVKVGEAKGQVYYRVTSDLGAREFGVYYKFIPTYSWGTLANATVQMATNFSSSSGNPATCAPTQYGASEAPIWDWGNGYDGHDWDGAWEFKSTHLSEPTAMIELCNVIPAIRVKAGTFNRVTKKRNPSIYVRCDSSSIIVWYKNGGCVLGMGHPIMHLSRNDVNEKGESWPQQYDHIYDALFRSWGSHPLPGGPNFPNVNPYTQKDIPGYSPLTALTRVANSTVIESQRAASHKICTSEIRKSWPGSVKIYGSKALNCDEFPFASTYQGALYANPGYNYSVRLINAIQNQKFGGSLGAWYQNNRILDGDGFLINAYTPVKWK